MQKNVTIIGEHQSEAIKNITLLYTPSTICVIIDESNKLNKSLPVISMELILSFLLLALHKFGYGDKFYHILCCIYQYRI